MSSTEHKKANFGNPIFNLFLTILVFLFFTWILMPYVPAKSFGLNLALSAFAATTLTVTFYFAVNMFMITLNDHKERSKQ
jgi:hypothetical protein